MTRGNKMSEPASTIKVKWNLNRLWIISVTVSRGVGQVVWSGSLFESASRCTKAGRLTNSGSSEVSNGAAEALAEIEVDAKAPTASGGHVAPSSSIGISAWWALDLVRRTDASSWRRHRMLMNG